MKQETAKTVRAFAIELVIYAFLVTGLFFSGAEFAWRTGCTSSRVSTVIFTPASQFYSSSARLFSLKVSPLF